MALLSRFYMLSIIIIVVKFSFWVQYNKASFSINCNVYLNGCLHRYSALANSHMSAYSIMQHSPGYYIPLFNIVNKNSKL